MKTVFFTLLLVVSLAALDEDEGLTGACAHFGGSLAEISKNRLYGPRCTVSLPIPTPSDDLARLACQLFMPGRVITSTPGEKTACVMEATLRCKPGWIQMYSYCYKLIRTKNHTKAEAVGACKSLGGNIAYIRHRYAVGSFKRYFRRISQVWIEVTPSLAKYAMEFTPGSDAYGLAISSKHYDFFAKPSSIVRIDPEWKLQALCEYKPPLTLSEIRYLGERYSEIYYPTVMVENGLIIRSGSAYTRPDNYNKLCVNVMKALQTDKVVDFNPDDAALRDLAGSETSSFTRSAGVAVHDRAKMRQKFCVQEYETYNVPSENNMIANYKLNFKGNEPSRACDSLRSAAIMHPKNKRDAILRTMSDSVSAPIWCKLGFTKKLIYDIPDGWHGIVRDDGTPVAHKFFPGPNTQDEAEKDCVKHGGHLSGFTSFREMEFLISLIPDHISNPNVPSHQRLSWTGAKRNPQCLNIASFDTDENSKCSRRKVMLWQNGVANTLIDESFWLNGHRNLLNPDYAGKYQKCMTLIRDRNQYWAERDQPGNLDDIYCEHKFSYLCQKTVGVTEGPAEF